MLWDCAGKWLQGGESYDVCIIGSGPAGLGVARQLLGSGLRVAVIESGGVEPSAEAHDLSRGPTTGDFYPPLETTRERRVGGTSHAWHIRCRETSARFVPFDAIDFEPRDWLPHSGWPIEPAELDAWYELAQVECGLGPYDYSAAAWSSPEAPPLAFADGSMTTSMFQFGPRRRFTGDWRRDLEPSATQDVLCNATAVEILTDASGRVATGVRLATPDSRRFDVFAQVVVLAAGGIDNARLLLMSDRARRAGLGNRHGLVGRFFMDHPLGPVDRLVPFDRAVFDRLSLYDLREVCGTHVMGKLHLSERVIRGERLAGLSAILFPRCAHHWSEAVEAARRVVRGACGRDSLLGGLASIGEAARGWRQVMRYLRERAGLAMPYYDLARGGWSALQRKGERFDSLAIMYQVEQAPDPNNRVTLSSQLDAHGCPRAEVHWRFGAADRERMNRGRQLIAQALERAGIGRVERAGTRLFSPSTHHHMGTTRAAHDPEAGVVDADLRVHGTENVYVAGSSVFPTGSYANPTLTIVALSLRLGAHIRAQLNGRRAQEARQRAASLLASGRPQAPITRAESMRSAR